MKLIKIIIAGLLLLFFIVNANANDAPLGLTWGMTESKVKKAGMKLSECKVIKFFKTCQAGNPPKSVSFADFYRLFFANGKGLQGINIAGIDITDDSSGREGKAQYAAIKSGLIKKYGQPSSDYEYTGRKLYDEYDELYQCLDYDGCGNWIAYWGTDVLSIKLELNGFRRGKGYVTLHYETKAFAESRDSYNQQNTTKDENAL